MNVTEYLKEIEKILKSGQATEHSYRGSLTALLQGQISGVEVINEPKQQDCGAPDYVLTRNKVPFGYLEAKKFEDGSLDAVEKGAQMKRYRESLENLILTDYLEFRLFRNEEKVQTVCLAEFDAHKNKLIVNGDQEGPFLELIREFGSFSGQKITSANQLAKLMAGKAKMLREVIANILTQNLSSANSLQGQFEAFKQVLIHDLTEAEFADIFAQTIVYGMFAARLHDKTLENFSRQEARELVPKSNPFLRKQFDFIAGADLDEQAVWIVDATADLFRCCDVWALLAKSGSESTRKDPMIHFYETFLGEYDKKLKKARGVYYTPEPVVNFMVRAVDEILKTEFGLKKGLADSSEIEIEVEVEKLTKTKGAKSQTKKVKENRKVHRVQILDPATGTGTFLAAIIRQIHGKFKNNLGQWPEYVTNHLIPRLHGFELMMAPYAMCHLKLELELLQTDYEPQPNQRLGVYLTNALEEAHEDTQTIFAHWLSQEAHEANEVKQESPVMVVIGNPPYAVSSSNKGEWIRDLIADYKKGLNERKLNLDDDYIKFIRYAQHRIDQTGQGIVAMITNNSFIDGVTHRRMRKSLLESCDRIYIIDLHGNAKKKETAPGGGDDKNVFDIMQGVSINIFIKTKNPQKQTSVFHYDVYGLRREKNELLDSSALNSLGWMPMEPSHPDYWYVPRDLSLEKNYRTLPGLKDFFLQYSTGVETQRDQVAVCHTLPEMKKTVEDFKYLTEAELRSKYDIAKDGRDWKLATAIDDVRTNSGQLIAISYRPFDFRKTYYSGQSKGFMAYPRNEVMRNLVFPDNVALLTLRQPRDRSLTNFFLGQGIIDKCIISSLDNAKVFPLYLYDDLPEGQTTTEEAPARHPNLEEKLVGKLAKKIKLTFTDEKEDTKSTFAPIDILDYIYAVLHSPNYREKYTEFLKIDFPRIPWPEDAKEFWALAKLGGQLRALHLMEAESLDEHDIGFNIAGSNLVEGAPKFKAKGKTNGQVWINDEQYFDQVPKIAWESYIGGYQPAQKWLKDRKGRKLSFDDVEHYQKMIKALCETDRLMHQINQLKEF